MFVGHLSDPLLCVSAVLLQVTGFTAGHIRGVLLDLCPKSFKPRFKNGVVLLQKSSDVPHRASSLLPIHRQQYTW